MSERYTKAGRRFHYGQYLHYDELSQVLAIDDPQLTFYLLDTAGSSCAARRSS
jgi:hypothetical protein